MTLIRWYMHASHTCSKIKEISSRSHSKGSPHIVCHHLFCLPPMRLQVPLQDQTDAKHTHQKAPPRSKGCQQCILKSNKDIPKYNGRLCLAATSMKIITICHYNLVHFNQCFLTSQPGLAECTKPLKSITSMSRFRARTKHVPPKQNSN